MFPQRLTDARGFDIAQAMLEGFNRHYTLFREASAGAQRRFEAADWHGQQRAQRERIEFYDKRVDEAVARLRGEFHIDDLSMDSWQQAKLHYIGLLTDHHLPDGDGLQAVAWVRARWSQVPALMLTGDSAPGLQALAQAQGVVVLHKPAQASQLLQALGQLLRLA